MSFLSGLICGLFISPAQFAPPDVPKNHWAYGAVNELFENGLLKGYPKGQPLTLKETPIDMAKVRERLVRWSDEKLLTSYETSPTLIGTRRRPPSKWELAVGVCAVWSGLQMDSYPRPQATSEVIEAELPEIADSISMFRGELKQLGVEPKQMIADLDYIRQYGFPKLELDKDRSYDRESVGTHLKRWKRENLLGSGYEILTQGRGGFDLDRATAYEQTVLVYGAWTVMSEDVAKYKEEIPDLVRAISMTQEYLVKLGGDPKEMIERLNRLQAKPSLRFRG